MNIDIPLFLQIVSTITVVIGFTFAAYQTLHIRRTRRDEVALTLMHTTAPPDVLARTIRRIWQLPDGANAQAIHALGPEVEQAIVQTSVGYENLGYLVYTRMIPLGLADEVLGGMIRTSWRKLHRWVEDLRAMGNPNAFEWFEWLNDRLAEHPAPGKATGAHVAHRNWKP